LKSWTWPLAAVLAVALTPCIFAQQPPEPPPVIDRIDIRGLSSVSESLVRSRIDFRVGMELTEATSFVIANDIRRLYELNFFTSIQVEVERTADGNVLTYVFQEERIIDEIIIIGNRKQSDRKIRAEMTWREGDIFYEEGNEAERDAILQYYRTKGYLNATVDFVVEHVSPTRVRLLYLISEDRKARISDIRFHGNETISSRSLYRTIKTGTGFLFFGGRYDEERFEGDLITLQNEYANVGHLEAVITHDFEYVKNGKGLIINIYVIEGPQYSVANVEFAENFVFHENELRDRIEITEGEVHNKAQVAADAALLGQLYRDSGYLNAGVDAVVTLDRDNHTTSIVHVVLERDMKYVRDIRITGNSVTKDEVIRRHVQLIPGDRFDGTRLRNSQGALNRTQYFANTNVRPVDPPLNTDQYTDIEVDVEEGKTGDFNFGAGFNTDEGVSGFGELALNNFDITNFPTFDGGGQQFRARFTVGSVRTNFNIGFTDPQFLGYPISFGADAFNERFSSRGGTSFVQTTIGGQLRLAKSLTNMLSASSFIRYTDVDITDLGTFADPRFRELENPGNTASIGLGFRRDSSNDFRDPTKGSIHDISMEYAGFGAENNFVKLNQEAQFFFGVESLPRWSLTLRQRSNVGAPLGSSDFIPLADRFYAGGGFTLRGYDTRDVGPLAQTVRVVNGDLIIDEQRIGGEARLLGTAEVKFKINDILRLYTFADGGGVWLEPEDFDPGDLKFGVGVGLGIEVPYLGPIRFDYGIPINPDSDQGGGQFYFQTNLRF
jgi:outer membrane protein insertion porin family